MTCSIPRYGCGVDVVVGGTAMMMNLLSVGVLSETEDSGQISTSLWLIKQTVGDEIYSLHHLQQHNRIRPSSRSYHGSATDYHAVSLVKRTEGHQIMAAATQKRRLMIGMIVRKLCRRSWMQWGRTGRHGWLWYVGKLCSSARWFGKEEKGAHQVLNNIWIF